ncbi:MAG: UDP-2,3-diacylglucosamine diphosphatase [Synergistaceae bacterium]|nr:UDP-2,3-diacylglucosamine diphosphatase [Synergistaceae bacterium]
MISVRTAFLSDLHLGSRWCRAAELSAFLDFLECETLYLVGDIVDGWSLKRRFRWPSTHTVVLGKILDLARRSRVVYVTGNHDAFMDEFAGKKIGNIEIRLSAIHETRRGTRFAVFHGDEMDEVTSTRPWLARIGDVAYSAALWANCGVNSLRKAFGLDYRSFSQGLKQRVKEAVNYVSGFEKKLAEEARRLETDGVVCGHIHKAAWQAFGETVLYGNCGDWVESCSALVERHDGSIELLDWETIREAIGIPVVTRRGEMVFRFPMTEPAPSWEASLASMELDPAASCRFSGQRG